jgi:hypothetical protein
VQFDQRFQRNLGRLLVVVAFVLILFDTLAQEGGGAGILLVGVPLQAVGAIVLGIGAWLWFIRSRRPER